MALLLLIWFMFLSLEGERILSQLKMQDPFETKMEKVTDLFSAVHLLSAAPAQ